MTAPGSLETSALLHAPHRTARFSAGLAGVAFITEVPSKKATQRVFGLNCLLPSSPGFVPFSQPRWLVQSRMMMQKTIRCRTDFRGSSRRHQNEQSMLTRRFPVVVPNKSWFLAGSYKVFEGAPDCQASWAVA